MLSCLDLKEDNRPKFSELAVTVNDLLEKDSGYLQLSLNSLSPAHYGNEQHKMEVYMQDMTVNDDAVKGLDFTTVSSQC